MDLEERAKELYDKEKELAKNNANEIVEKSSNNNGTIDLERLQTEFLKKQIEKGQSLSEISVDFAKSSITNEIINGQNEDAEKYRKELADEQKQTIKESFKQDKTKAQSNTLDEKRKKAEAFYLSVRPILEFDFNNLVKKEKEQKIKPSYNDRSYGIPLMVGMIIFLTVPYFLISIILALFNGINAILEEISTFGKIARYIVLSILIVAVALLIIYCAILGVESLFNVKILPLK